MPPCPSGRPATQSKPRWPRDERPAALSLQIVTVTLPEPTPLAAAILLELNSSAGPGGMSLPRLGKRLGQGVSALMRELSLMSDARIGDRQGPGWVRVVQVEERWIAHITPAGQDLLAQARPVGRSSLG